MYDEWDEIENELSKLSNLIENENKNENENENEKGKGKDIENNNYIEKEEKIIPNPTPLRISTMTGLSSFSTNINLEIINKFLPINDNIVYIDPGSNDPVRGLSKKKISNKSYKKKKMFFNQTTIIINLFDNRSVNIKVFSNGNIQMTGLKSIDDGIKACNLLKDELINLSGSINDSIIEAIPEKSEIELKDINIVLINSDYFCGYKIKRDVLHKLIIKKYKLFSSYEPCIYPGVNTKYYWNKNNILKDGICRCTKKCSGKGLGDGDGECKKITCSVFQSGNVIITGARDLEQIEDAYEYINKIFKNHMDILKRNNQPAIFEDNYQKKDKFIMIKKKNIK